MSKEEKSIEEKIAEASDPNATPECIIKYLNDDSQRVRIAAAENPNTTTDIIFIAYGKKSK